MIKLSHERSKKRGKQRRSIKTIALSHIFKIPWNIYYAHICLGIGIFLRFYIDSFEL